MRAYVIFITTIINIITIIIIISVIVINGGGGVCCPFSDVLLKEVFDPVLFGCRYQLPI